MVKNHFGDGVMDGVKCYEPCAVGDMQRYCLDYRRGYVCGFAYSLGKRLDDRYLAACRAGELARQYGLAREAIAEFFLSGEDSQLQRYYYHGYERN